MLTSVSSTMTPPAAATGQQSSGTRQARVPGVHATPVPQYSQQVVLPPGACAVGGRPLVRRRDPLGGWLDLSSNKISTLPESFASVTVGGFLYLENNPLTTFPKSFPNVKGRVKK